MRIHTNTIDRADLTRALHIASAGGHGLVDFQDAPTRHGSRTHGSAWTVKLEGDGSVSRRRTNFGRPAYGEPAPYAATYDSWGWFLGHLFTVDPTMHAGPYRGADDFHAQTHGAYNVDAMLELQRREFEATSGMTYGQAERAGV